MIMRCAALRHVHDMHPELDFTPSSIAIFMSTHATDARFYHYTAKIGRPSRDLHGADFCFSASSEGLWLTILKL